MWNVPYRYALAVGQLLGGTKLPFRKKKLREEGIPPKIAPVPLALPKTDAVADEEKRAVTESAPFLLLSMALMRTPTHCRACKLVG